MAGTHKLANCTVKVNSQLGAVSIHEGECDSICASPSLGEQWKSKYVISMVYVHVHAQYTIQGLNFSGTLFIKNYMVGFLRNSLENYNKYR